MKRSCAKESCIWVFSLLLAALPYLWALSQYPYVAKGGAWIAVGFLAFFSPPAFILAAILLHKSYSKKSKKGPKGLINTLFLLDILFYVLMLYQFLINL